MSEIVSVDLLCVCLCVCKELGTVEERGCLLSGKRRGLVLSLDTANMAHDAFSWRLCVRNCWREYLVEWAHVCM